LLGGLYGILLNYAKLTAATVQDASAALEKSSTARLNGPSWNRSWTRPVLSIRSDVYGN
jgi:hypothetical protein